MSIQNKFFRMEGFNLEVVIINEDIYFREKDICKALGYEKPRNAINNYVYPTHKKSLSELSALNGGVCNIKSDSIHPKTIYLTESGFYELALSSKLPSAIQFRLWVVEEVIPNIRKEMFGALKKKVYNLNRTRRDFKIENEEQLHKKVVDFIRSYRPELVIIPGLGENQTTSDLRLSSWYKGYTKGQPDLMIDNHNKYYKGFCIEFKNPKGTGVLHESQIEMLERLEENGNKILISHDYDEIIVAIVEYCRDLRYPCLKCNKKFKSRETLKNHKEGLKHAG